MLHRKRWGGFTAASGPIVVGLDLAGVETRPTGFCILDDRWRAQTRLLYRDAEILEETLEARPSLVSIDAPLWLPKGRCCLRDECVCRSGGHLRECDRALLRMGIKFFPVTLGPMRLLTVRGICLREALEAKEVKVIESYPGSIQDILQLPRKKRGVERLRRALIEYGVKGAICTGSVTDHELDAVTSALVGQLFLEGKAMEIGTPDEALMVIPKPGLGREGGYPTPRGRLRKGEA